jgi:hypothetical protein
MRRRNEPTGTPGARYGEAWTPVAESKLTLVVPWIAQKPARFGPTHRRALRGCLWPYGGWIGFHAAAPCSLVNGCYPRPVNGDIRS